MSSSSLPKHTPVLFPVGSRLVHKKGGVYRVVAAPDSCRIEKTLEPAYAYISGDGAIWIRPQVEMEDGRFKRMDFAGDQYEDILDMVSSGDGLEERLAAGGFGFLDIPPQRAWDVFIAALTRSAEAPGPLSRFLNQVQFEATELRNYFLKRRTF